MINKIYNIDLLEDIKIECFKHFAIPIIKETEQKTLSNIYKDILYGKL